MTNIRWDSDRPGKGFYYNPNSGTIPYSAALYKDGVEILLDERMGGKPGIMSYYSHSGGNKYTFSYDIFDSGTYTFKVKTYSEGEKPDYDYSTGVLSDMSDEFVYTRPSSQIAVPDNIKWNSDGVVTYDAVEHAERYVCLVYKVINLNDGSQYYAYQGGAPVDGNTTHDLKDKLGNGGSYYVRVRACSEDITQWANGEWSDYIPYDGNTVSQSVNDILKTANEKEINTAVNEIKANFAGNRDELQIAMQTSDETQALLGNIESRYKNEKNLNIVVNPSDDTGISSSSVSILGAALNATEAGGTINFNLSKPSNDIQKEIIARAGFSKAIVLDLNLQGAGITEGQELDVPVTVTMPIPEGFEKSHLAVLHKKNESDAGDIINVRFNDDGTISFTVTHFSFFVFGQNETAQQGNSSKEKSDKVEYDKSISDNNKSLPPAIKSTLPYGTVAAFSSQGESMTDLKALAPSQRDINNHNYFANHYASAMGFKATSVNIKELYAPYGATDNWKKNSQIIKWKNTGVKSGDKVYITWYCQDANDMRFLPATVLTDGTIQFTVPCMGSYSIVGIYKLLKSDK